MKDKLKVFEAALDDFYIRQIASCLLSIQECETDIRFWEKQRADLRKDSNDN